MEQLKSLDELTEMDEKHRLMGAVCGGVPSLEKMHDLLSQDTPGGLALLGGHGPCNGMSDIGFGNAVGNNRLPSLRGPFALLGGRALLGGLAAAERRARY